MNIEYNYQRHPHRYRISQTFDFVLWGCMITLAFLVGFAIIPWWVFLIVIAPYFLKLNVSRSWAVTSSVEISEKKAKEYLGKLKKDESPI